MLSDKLHRFTVWAGGVEVNDYMLTESEAQAIARSWREQGYDDVQIEELETC